MLVMFSLLLCVELDLSFDLGGFLVPVAALDHEVKDEVEKQATHNEACEKSKHAGDCRLIAEPEAKSTGAGDSTETQVGPSPCEG